MENLKIIKVKIDELHLLQKISRETFSDTFSAQNTAEDLNIYLENELSLENLAFEIQDENGEFYFVKFENKVIAYLKISFGESTNENEIENALQIERIYVSKEFLGKKIGQILLDKAIDIAKMKGNNAVWLGVWEENFRAINFYKKNGFVEFGKHIFMLGNDKQTDIEMKLILK